MFDLSIWPSQKLKFMSASREGMRKHVSIGMACKQLQQSCETGNRFFVVIKGDFNVEGLLIWGRIGHHLELD